MRHKNPSLSAQIFLLVARSPDHRSSILAPWRPEVAGPTKTSRLRSEQQTQLQLTSLNNKHTGTVKE